jgi:peroxiredoxin Q/BCP
MGMPQLQEGDKAPLFSGIDQNGKKVSLSDYKDKKVILYFYPEDDTPTCTIQACNLRDNYGLLKRNGFIVVGISPDEQKKHKKFEAKFGLPFTLVADPQHNIISKYGVWGKKKLYGREYMGIHRTTFLIDEKGLIRKIFTRPKNKQHAQEILDSWKEIQP